MKADEEEQDVAELEEPEEANGDEPLDVPPERRRVKTEKQDLPVETLQAWVKRGKIDLQPEFQRMFVWEHYQSQPADRVHPS